MSGGHRKETVADLKMNLIITFIVNYVNLMLTGEQINYLL